MRKVPLELAAMLLLGACASYEPRPLDGGALADAFLARRLDGDEVREFFGEQHRAVPESTWDFDDLWLAALCCNAQLTAARAEVALAAAAVEQARQLPNPRASLTPEWGINYGVSGNPTPWVLGFSLTWPLELGGKRATRIEIAERQQVFKSLGAAVLLWQAREQLSARCLQYEFAAARERLAEREAALMARIAELTEQRMLAGAISRAETMATRIARQQADSAALAAVDDVRLARQQLANAIGVPATALAAVTLPGTFAVPDPGENGPTELLRIAMQARVDLQQQVADYAVREAELDLEVKRQYPNIDVGPGYLYDQGQHKLMLGLSFDLPIFNQNQGAIAIARAARDVSAAAFAAAQTNAIGEVELGMAAHATGRRQLAAAAESSRLRKEDCRRTAARHQAGLDDALTLANMQHAELLAERDLLAARERAALAAVQLEQAVGLPLAAAPLASIARAAEEPR